MVFDGQQPVPGRRIVVIGSTGSGKTTMARELAQRLGVPHVEMDALHWEPGWEMAPTDEFRRRIVEATAGDGWAIDGNYGKVRDLVWPRADTVVWLDYSMPVIMWRLWRRTLRRVFRREELWNGNRESFRGAFLSRDSLFIWALQTYRRRKHDYPRLLRQPEHAHLRLIRLTSPRAADRWLAQISS